MGTRKNQPTDVFKYIDMKGGDFTQCWPWTGSTGGRADDKRPYFQLDGKKQLAYRVVYRLYVGELKDDELIRHTCDTPLCCNPMHHMKGTELDNTKDKVSRERHGGVPASVASRIRSMYATGQYTQKQIAAMFNIARETVSAIVTGRRRADQQQENK